MKGQSLIGHYDYHLSVTYYSSWTCTCRQSGPVGKEVGYAMLYDWWHVWYCVCCVLLYPVQEHGTDATPTLMQECDACTWHLYYLY